MAALRTALFGLCLGVGLSALRAPAGLDLFELPLPAARTRALWRALALLLPGLVLWVRRLPGPASRSRAGLWLLSAGLGLGVHGLLFAPQLAPASGGGLACCAVLLLVSLLLCSERREEGSDSEQLRALESLGLCLAGACAAMALELCARPLRMITGGQRWEDALLAAILCAATALGALAFGPQGARLIGRPCMRALALALSAPLCLFALSLCSPLAQLAGLQATLDLLVAPGALLGLDLTLDPGELGTLGWSSLLGARVLLVPGMALGAALACAGCGRRLACLCLGAAVGTALLPSLLDARARPLDPDQAQALAQSWRLVRGLAVVASLGALFSLFGDAARGRARAATVATIALLTTAAFIATPRGVLTFSPWAPLPIQPELVLETAEGVFTVERAPGGATTATLDRRHLTPGAEGQAADRARFERSFALLGERERAPVVLLLGLLTPARAAALAGMPAHELMRSTPWHRHAASLEGALFGDASPPPGRITPAEARAALAAGRVELVIVPPIFGPRLAGAPLSFARHAAAEAPQSAQLMRDDGPPTVVWIDSAADTGGLELGPQVLFAGPGLDELSLGVARSGSAAPIGGVQATAAGPRSQSRYLTRWQRRGPQQRAALARRLLTAAPADGPEHQMLRGLTLLCAAQVPSSPWETRAEAIEIDPEGLEALCSAALLEAPDPFLSELLESLAGSLSAKRMPEEVLAHIEPVARARAPWPELARHVARAEMELLQPARAIPWLEQAAQARPLQLELWRELATARSAAGDAAGAAAALERALAIQPGRTDLERLLGLSLAAAELPGAEPLLRAALARDSQDAEVLRALAEL